MPKVFWLKWECTYVILKTICAIIYYLVTEEIISACTDFKFPYFSTQYNEFIITTLLYHKFFIVIHVIILP